MDPPGAPETQAAEVETFRDCRSFPEMVVIPAGRFRMGCASGSDDCDDDESPVHEVEVASFALSQTPDTVAPLRAEELTDVRARHRLLNHGGLIDAIADTMVQGGIPETEGGRRSDPIAGKVIVIPALRVFGRGFPASSAMGSRSLSRTSNKAFYC